MNEKILIVGPAWVGDMVMAQSLFKLIKAQQPSATIDVLAPAWSLPLLERMPEISNAIAMPIGHGKLKLIERYKLGKILRKQHYQQAIILPNSFKSALIPFFANIPKRTGWRGEMRYILLNDMRSLDKKNYPLMVQRFMALGLNAKEHLPSYQNFLPTLETSAFLQESALQKFNLNVAKPILVICPGAEFGPAKRWPEKYFAEVANKKIQAGWQVWLLGSAKDTEVTNKIMQLTEGRCRDLAGKTMLVETVDLLALATFVLTNDSGLMHIAAALYKPLIAVYGPTSPDYTPPLHADAQIVKLNLSCQPCFKRECPLQHNQCMQNLLPHQVLQRMSEVVS